MTNLNIDRLTLKLSGLSKMEGQRLAHLIAAKLANSEIDRISVRSPFLCGALSHSQSEVNFLTCPLQMVLKMAGFEHFRWQIHWLGNRQLILNFDG
jgi:hypothetical protein